MAESVCGQTDRLAERQTGRLADRQKDYVGRSRTARKEIKIGKIKLIFENILLKVKKIKNM